MIMFSHVTSPSTSDRVVNESVFMNLWDHWLFGEKNLVHWPFTMVGLSLVSVHNWSVTLISIVVKFSSIGHFLSRQFPEPHRFFNFMQFVNSGDEHTSHHTHYYSISSWFMMNFVFHKQIFI